MHTVRYASTEHTPVPVYNNKGEVLTTGVVHTTQLPETNLPSKVVLLDTRIASKQGASYLQQQTIDKEALNMQHVRAYETKGDERLDRDESVQQQPGAIVQSMQKPLPSIPPPANVKSSELLGRTTSESEPQYVTVYEDGAQLFSPRTISLLGSAARLPPPPPPSADSVTTTETMQYPATAVPIVTPAPTVVQSKSTTSAQPSQQQPAIVHTTATSQSVGLVDAPSPAVENAHWQAAAKHAVQTSSTVQPSPLIASAGPQPYDLPHPKNAIDVVQLPPPQPTVPVANVETVVNKAAPLPLLPPTQQVAPVTKPVPALPAPTQAPRPSLPQTAYERAQPRIQPAAPAPVPAAPRRQWKMPGLFDMVFSPYAIGAYLLLGLLALTQLPFWLLVTLAVGLDAVVIAYIKRPAKQTSTALVLAQPRPMALPAPSSSITQAVLPLPAPASLSVQAPSTAPTAHHHHSHHHHHRSSSREFGTQTEVPVAMEEHVEGVPVPRSPAEFFASLRQQHGGSPPAKDRQATDRLIAQHDVPIMKKLAPSARQQATIPLLADAQVVAPEGVHLSESYHTAPSPSTANSSHKGYVHPVPHVQPSALPSPSNLPNPMLDALNSASPRRELNQLTHSGDQYSDMQPDAALSSQVAVAARRGVAGIPSSDAAAAVQGAANPVVVVPSWPSSEQQHEIAQARQVVEASTVRDHSVLLDDASADNGTHTPPQSQPYSMQAVPHSTTLVNQTNDMMALPAPKGPVSTTAPLALPFPSAPSFKVSAADSATTTTTTTAVQTSAPVVQTVKRVVSEEKEVVADVGAAVSVDDVGAGITDSNGMRLRNIASHSHTQ